LSKSWGRIRTRNTGLYDEARTFRERQKGANPMAKPDGVIMNNQNTNEEPRRSLTDEHIVTEKNLPRRSFLAATGAVLVGGAAALVLGRSSMAQTQDPDKAKTAEPDKAKAQDPDKAKAGDPDKAKAGKAKGKGKSKAKAADPDKAKAQDPDKAKSAEPSKSK